MSYLLFLNMRILILFTLLLLPTWILAQHNHFIYIQGEHQQLFYVKKSGELLSSSSTGFLILPKLQPGTHQFTIGFPKDQFPEYAFTVEISGKDRGFTLKNFQDKGWGLFDMQSMDVVMGRRIEVKKTAPPTYGAMSDDPFSMILASVVNDPGIRETSLVQSAVWVSAPAPKALEKQDKSIAARDTRKPDTKLTLPEPKPKPVEPKELPVETGLPVTVAATENKPVPPPSSTETVAAKTIPAEPAKNKPAEKYAAQKVVKISELKTWTGYQLTFVDQTGAVMDTIQVIIDDAQPETLPAKTEPATADVAKTPRADCKAMAREKDVLNLRKKMLTIAKDADMVETAMKELKSKCFTVDQVQNLSYVFVTDQGRMLLFEQAYPYIFDPANYHRLEKLLNSEEYQQKFKTIIK